MLALGYVILVGAIIAALAGWISADLNNTSKFSFAQSYDSALNSTVELAVQSIRYTPLVGTGQTLNASPPSYCWGSAPPSTETVNGYSIDVWCSTLANYESSTTRVVTISACASTTSAAACSVSPQLQAVVIFDDYASGDTPIDSVCTVTCGTSMAIESWTFEADALGP